MDVMRTCKTKQVFWDAAKTRSSEIIWYRVPDDTPFFPGPHVFSDERYDTVHWWNPGAGEDDDVGYDWYSGAPPVNFQPTAPCGDLDWFANGAPSDAPALPRDKMGFPVCCPGGGQATSVSGGPGPGPSGGSAGSGGDIEVHCFGCTVLPAVWIVTPLGNWSNRDVCTQCPIITGTQTAMIYYPLGATLPVNYGAGLLSPGCVWVGQAPNACPTISPTNWWVLRPDPNSGDPRISLVNPGGGALIDCFYQNPGFACVGLNVSELNDPASYCQGDVNRVQIAPG